jgi:DNA-directed RNA polymerase subunit RPC12/RpoP
MSGRPEGLIVIFTVGFATLNTMPRRQTMKCPGQDTQYWKPGAIYEVKCPACGHKVEFFKDDTTRRCGHCGHRFVNPRLDFGCAAYCPFAEQCLGTLPPEALAERENLLKDRVAVEVKRLFKSDFARIGRTTRLARHAERIAKEEGGNLPVVLVTAYLNETGKAPGDASKAREILDRLGAREKLVTAVCQAIEAMGDGKAQEDATLDILRDAQRIVALEAARRDGAPPPEPDADAWATGAGRRLAEEISAKAA